MCHANLDPRLVARDIEARFPRPSAVPAAAPESEAGTAEPAQGGLIAALRAWANRMTERGLTHG